MPSIADCFYYCCDYCLRTEVEEVTASNDASERSFSLFLFSVLEDLSASGAMKMSTWCEDAHGKWAPASKAPSLQQSHLDATESAIEAELFLHSVCLLF